MRYEVPTITVPFLYYPLCNPPPRITINHRISKNKKMQEINQNKNENLQKIEGKDGRNKKRDI